MKSTSIVISISFVALLCCSLSSAAGAESQRQVVRVDDSGVWIEIQTVSGPAQRRPMDGDRGVPYVIWHTSTPDSTTARICLSDSTNETWVGHEHLAERLAYHQTTGDGTPIWEFDLESEDPFGSVRVDSAEDASLGVILVISPVTGITSVRAFNSTAGPTPIWTYNFPAGFNSSGAHSVSVSADGAIVAAVAYPSANAAQSTTVILDGTNGNVLNSLVSESVTDVQLCADGSRAVLTRNAIARVIDTSTMAIIHTFQIWGGGSPHRISRDGTVVLGGAGDFEVWQEVGGAWQQIYYIPQQNDEWFGAGIGLSDDNATLFLATHSYTDLLTHRYRVIDLVNGVVLAQMTAIGTGSLQDAVQWAVSSANGRVFAMASWGTENNDHPEVQIFDRDLNLIGSIDTPGSPMDLDMSRDGRYVVVGGKAVHANTPGMGSDTYAYFLPAPECPADFDGSGSVDAADLAQLLGAWGPNPGHPADFNEDGIVNAADLAQLLGAWGPCL